MSISNIRPFDLTWRDAQRLIDIDQATFGDCHYAPAYLLELAAGGQYIWVAELDHEVVGFVSAFAVHTLAGSRWEIDELAVHPSAQGRGLGTALIARALSDAPALSEAHTVIAHDNLASQRAFIKNGFVPSSDVSLYVYDASKPVRARVLPPEFGLVSFSMPAPHDVAILSGFLGSRDRARSLLSGQVPETFYRLVLLDGVPMAWAELVHVRTLQYEGWWLESLRVTGRLGDNMRFSALLREIADEAHRAGHLDLVGHLLDPARYALHSALQELGFGKINDYILFTRPLENPY